MPDAEIQEILTEIAAKKAKANELALEFRRLYRESQKAWADEDKELAKQLSEEGHETQAKCEALNEEVKGLYRDLKELNAKRRGLFSQDNLPSMALRGMPSTFQEAVIETLKLLPSHHISAKLIERVSYSDRYVVNPQTKIPKQAELVSWKIGGKPYIRINRQTREGFTEIEDLKIAVAHEIGHVVYRKFLTDGQRAEWEASFKHKKGDSEDSFAQCYALYYLRKEWLAEEHVMVKQFFDQLNL
jgi:hypothetical protein